MDFIESDESVTNLLYFLSIEVVSVTEALFKLSETPKHRPWCTRRKHKKLEIKTPKKSSNTNFACEKHKRNHKACTKECPRRKKPGKVSFACEKHQRHHKACPEDCPNRRNLHEHEKINKVAMKKTQRISLRCEKHMRNHKTCPVDCPNRKKTQ